MLKFNKVNLSSSKVDSWISMNQNVLLIGEKGVGKTQRVLEGFERNKLKYAYFSGSTLDPWIHLIGVPKVNDEDKKMDFILPRNLDENVEAVFIDEFNRSPKIVRNAILELLQFKSINGRKFPKLKIVWAAINPPKDENDEETQEYDVEDLDPAQMDRFQIIVELPNQPDKKYFKEKFGDYHGSCLVDWWKEQSKEAKKILSPRRLEYVGSFYKQGGDIADLLPVSANTAALIKQLSVSQEDILLDKVFNNPDETIFKEFFSQDKNYLKYRERINKPKYWHLFKFLKPEYLCENIKTNDAFQNYAILNYLRKEQIYISAIEEVSKSTKNNILLKACKLLERQNVDINSAITIRQTATNTVKDDRYGKMPDSFSNCTAVKDIESTIGSRLDIDFIRDCFTTQEYRGVFSKIADCYQNIPDKNYKMVASVVFAMLDSCQAGTLQQDPYFFKTFHNVILKIKSILSAAEWKICEKKIITNQRKFPTTGYYDNILKITQESSSANDYAVSKEFAEKVESAFALVNLAQDIK